MKGHVYFARMSSGPIKIGFTTDMPKRMANLWHLVPGGVEVMGSFLGTPEAEVWLHRKFAADRISGEWFSPSSDLLALIESVKSVGNVVVPEECRAEEVEITTTRIQGDEAKVLISHYLKKISEPRAATDKTKDLISRAASRTGLTESRSFEIWYERARAITAAEFLAIKEVYDASVARRWEAPTIEALRGQMGGLCRVVDGGGE